VCDLRHKCLFKVHTFMSQCRNVTMSMSMFMRRAVCLAQFITTGNCSARKMYGDYLSQLPCKNQFSKAILDNSRSQHYDCAHAYAVLPKEHFILSYCSKMHLNFSTIPLTKRMPHLRAFRTQSLLLLTHCSQNY
jgi:hypothetical protein